MKNRKINPIISKLTRAIFKCTDILVFSAFLASALIALIDGKSRSRAVIILIFSMIILITVLIEDLKKKKDVAVKKQQAKEEILIERATLMADTEIASRIQENSFAFIRKENPDKYEIIQAVISQPMYLICIKESSLLHEILDRYASHTKLITALELSEIMGVPCTNEDIEQRINGSFSVRIDSKRLMNAIFARWNRYVLLGILLLVLSFFTKHKIYYRLLASICLIFAVFRGVFGRNVIGLFSASFLDKLDR